MKLNLKQMILAAIFAAFTAIMAQISIPVPFSPVPITLSLFAVFLSGAILGSRYGALSQLVYVLLGACGVPVFQGFTGGLSVIVGYKGGYIVSYIFMAFAIGLIIERRKSPSRMDMVGSMVFGLIICYALGATWLGIYFKYDVAKTILVGVTPFLPLDILKVAVAGILSYEVRTALVRANLLQTRTNYQ